MVTWYGTLVISARRRGAQRTDRRTAADPRRRRPASTNPTNPIAPTDPTASTDPTVRPTPTAPIAPARAPARGADPGRPPGSRESRTLTHQDTWTGQWVADRLGVRLDGDPELRDLLGLALRRNPRRAHLLVSNVLGKHVPQLPAAVHGAGLALGARVRDLLGPDEARRAVVLGYAETATGLGHSVADGLGAAPYLHSTRRPVAGVEPVGGFEEEHSHATSHLLLPEDPALLSGGGPLVLVDDEFSTGRTVLNTIRAVHATHPRERYVIVALVDVRDADQRDHLAKAASDLGARLDLVAAASGTVHLPPDVLARAQALVAAESAAPAPRLPAPAPAPGAEPAPAPLTRADLDWPADLPDGGRHGFTPAHRARLEAALPGLGRRLAATLTGAPRRVLVLGFEELMYTPLRLAEALAAALGDDTEVRFSTTTRSPVLAVDHPGYAIRTRLAFPAHDAPADGPGERYAYNVDPGADPARRFDAVVLVVDDPADTPALHHPERGLTTQLRRLTDQVVLAVVPSRTPLPRPRQGTEPPRQGVSSQAAPPQ